MSKIDELMRQGLQLHQSGRNVDAEAIYRRVLDKQPSHAAANHLLGVSLLQRGDAAAAVTHLQRAVHARPADAEYLGNLGTALNAIGNSREAVSVFDRALKLQPGNAGALHNRGMALKAMGRLTAAIESYRAAIALRPAEAGFHRNLGNALAAQGDWPAAESGYRKALELRPNFPNALTGLCLTLEALQRTDEAIAAAQDYARQFPAASEFHRALGQALWIAGRPDEAAAAYRAAIAANPRDVEAHRLLGLIVRRHAADGEVRALETLAAESGFTEDQAAQLEFALGLAFDDIGDASRSDSHYTRANALVRKTRPFDIEKARSEMQALQDAFARLPDTDVPPLAPATGPVFIVGLPRSGKSTLEGMLARHPGVFPAGELPTLGNVAREIADHGDEGAGLLVPSSEQRAEIRTRYLQIAGVLAPGKRLLDTMPNNFLLVGAIRVAIPDARVIHCVREPEAHIHALSRKYFAQTGNGYVSDAATLLDFHGLYRRLTAFWAGRFPGLLLDVDMTDAPAAARAACAFLGISWLSDMALPYISEPRIASERR